MYKIEGENVQKGSAQGITQRNYRVSSQAIRGGDPRFSSTGIFALRDHLIEKILPWYSNAEM
jgi:hypothetical protein